MVRKQVIPLHLNSFSSYHFFFSIMYFYSKENILFNCSWNEMFKICNGFILLGDNGFKF